ncbi:MAG: hypothetical protein ACK5WZ_02985 [Pseudobdellovibrionaceae bacterium]
MNQSADNIWKKCSSCKKNIHIGEKYYVCNVSSCQGQRTGYQFCSVACFESHLPGARHRDAWALERKATAETAGGASSASISSTKQTLIVRPQQAGSGSAGSKTPLPREVVIIASRLKEYISAKSDMNTSSNVMDVLSDYVRVLCDRAIDHARAEGRKTVLDRDFDFLKKLN